jgi:transposase
MSTRKFRLTEQQAQALQVAYLHSHDGATRTRYQAVRLYGVGYVVEEIQQICGCSQRSLLEWCQVYRAEGISGLVDHRLGGNRAQLSPMEIEALSQLLHGYTPARLLGPDGCEGPGQHWSVNDLRQLVWQQYGVRYKSPTSYHTLFNRCDFSYQRATKQYLSRNELKVMDFEERLEKNSLTWHRSNPTP